jgi:hypothetical protein
MSVAAVTQSVDSAELVRTVGALLPLLFAFAAILRRRDEEPRTAEREEEQQLPLFLATSDAHESSHRDPRLVSRR